MISLRVFAVWGAAVASAAIAAPSQATVVQAGSISVDAGDSFSIPVSIVDGVELQSWQFDLAFDPSLLQANLVTEGGFLSSSGAALTLFDPGIVDNAAGLISLISAAYLDLPPGPSGSGVLVEIEFTALASGTSALSLSNAFLDFGTTDFDAIAGSVCVNGVLACDAANGVPEPPMLALLLAAAGAWRLAQRRTHS